MVSTSRRRDVVQFNWTVGEHRRREDGRAAFLFPAGRTVPQRTTAVHMKTWRHKADSAEESRRGRGGCGAAALALYYLRWTAVLSLSSQVVDWR
jgi:hypothetical protein